MTRYYKLGVLLSHYCNQKCEYCNNYSDKVNTIVDIDYLMHILDAYHKYGIDNMYVELSGGEPGLLTNIDDIISELYSLPYIVKLDVLSNGYMRKYKYYLLEAYPKLTCIEHTAKQIVGKDIKYFYDDITYYNNEYKNVEQLLVLDEVTVDSLIDNFEYYRDEGFFKHNIFLKIVTPKNIELSKKLIAKYNTLYDKLDSILLKNNDSKLYMDRYFLTRNTFEKIRNVCCRISSMQYIDLENNIIGQCSMNIEETNKAEITEQNIAATIKGNLFTKKSKFCDKCIKYSSSAYKYYNSIVNNNIYNFDSKVE